MNKIAPIIFLFALTNVCLAQLSDDFSDGDFTSNPTWSGSASQFIVNASGQLQLNNSVAGQSYLSTAFATASLDNFEWQFYVKQSFSPSSTNYGRVYLVSDQADLTQPLNGYFLQFGETGSADAIQLFKQSGSTSTLVCRGKDSTIAKTFFVRVKVTRDNAGLWSLYTDYTGGTNFILEKSNSDLTINSSSFFGVRCNYTVTNATKFYYDDFLIIAPPPPIDTTPPSIVKVDTLSNRSLLVTFSEALDQSSAATIQNYSVDNLIGSPTSAALQADGKSVALTFSNNFGNGIQNQLTISSVKDLAGNAMGSSTVPFTYFHSSPSHNKDIILTEIFADPSPQVGLPAQEFLEIYNRSSVPFDLSGWKLSDGVSTATFDRQIIQPKQYWIVCASANANLFSGYGNVVGVSNFPTLNNGGDDLTLKNNLNQTIDSVNYTLDWYHDVDKQDGGWSLEIIDVNNTCGEANNWAASEDPTGGTPGKQNSIFANKPDLTGPQLSSVVPVSSTKLILGFDEKLEKDLSTVSFTLNPSVTITKKYFVDQSLKQIELELAQTLELRVLYLVTVSNLTDCAGNFIQQEFNKLSFALPEAADSLDILINEILFNPKTGGVDFVEVYNNSPKFINLKNWKLANDESGVLKNITTITTSDFILAPSTYLAFTPDPSIVSLQYPQSIQKNLFKTSLPSLPDNAGTIALVSDSALVADHFTYSEQMHSPFIKDNEGVSLERISFSESTNEASNWKSANSASGFATPGFINSNARPATATNDNAILIDPEIFSPSVPGKDFSKINYKFDQSGMAANVKILDTQGRLIKTLANNETLPQEGSLRWDGDRDDGSRSRIGYYVVWFEVVDNGGAAKVFRKRVVIGK
jgi:hypothetical protein